MSTVLAAAGPSPLWYLSRGTGVVTLVLLTASVVLGILNTRRWSPQRWPRFVIDGLHRNVSLLVLAILAIHVVSVVADSFAPIALKDAVIPFAASYRRVWLGLGAMAFDLLLAVAVSSMLRGRLGHRAWRRVHWLAYACWPVALIHGLGTGTDTTALWMLAVSLGCLVAVWMAAWTRVSASYRDAPGRAIAAFAALLLAPLALALWVPRGPLGSAWARRAGTPTALLAATSHPSGSRTSRAAAARKPGDVLVVPFRSQLGGRVQQGETAGGLATVDLAMTFDGLSPGSIDVRIEGEPVAGGGVSMTASQVTMGPGGDPGAYRGRVVSLAGQNVLAVARDQAGRSVRLDLALSIDSATGSVRGEISAQPGSGAS